MKELGKEMNDNFCAIKEMQEWDDQEGRFGYGTMVITAIACGWVMGSGLVTALLYWVNSGSAY